MKSNAHNRRGFLSGSAAFVPHVDCDMATSPLEGLPFPQLNANKYSRGKLTLVAGSVRYPGAAVLAARAAQRMGAGYVEVVAPKEIANIVVGAVPSLVVTPLEQWTSLEALQTTSSRPCAVCVGPGFDASDPLTERVVLDVLEKAACPVLVDGGGLSALASTRAIRFLERRFANGLETILTPHGGEAIRLARGLGIAHEGLDDDQLARALSLATGGIVVLKGPDTYISDGDVTKCIDEGTAALAKAGTGDVLAGMISALLAQGIEAFDACELGVRLHARAGVAAAQIYTEIGVTPEDVIECVAEAIRRSSPVETGAIGFA